MEEFGKCLDVPYEDGWTRQGFTCGWDGYEKHKYYFSISRLSEHELYTKRARNSGSTPNWLIMYFSNLSMSDRMLSNFIAYILLPKHSNHSQINDTKMQIIYVVKNKLKINWAYVIMHHMHHQRWLSGGLPYVRLITKILEFFDINLIGEPKKIMTSKECEITVGVANKNMGIYKDKDGIYKHRDIVPSFSSDAHIPEGGYTNEVIYKKMCSLETLVINGFRDLHFELAELRNQNQKDSEEEVEYESD